MAKNSRREFLKTVAVGSLAPGLLTPVWAGAQPTTTGDAGIQSIHLRINGQGYALGVDPRLTLLDTLRDRLDLTGTKRLCDRAACGACTVIVDGRPHYACALLAVDAAGRDIRTIEGVAAGGRLHAVQARFCEQDALMCGFCTPGCVMAAVALLEAQPAAGPDDMARALDGHVCRCGARVARAAAAAARDPAVEARRDRLLAVASVHTRASLVRGQAARYAWPERPTLIGARISRIDGPVKATGRARFTHDITRPGLLHAKVLRSPHAHARLMSLDLSPARAAPGVGAALPLLTAGQKVVFAGQEVAAVAAATEGQALDALRLIKVEWDVLPHLATIDQAARPEAPQVFEPANTRAFAPQEAGDLESGWRVAAQTVEGLYSTQVHSHVCPETHAAVCEWTGTSLTAWLSTQAVHGMRDALATALGIPPANVRVIAEHVGGGFGSKLTPGVEAIACARLARLANRPVKLLLDRKEEHLATGNRASAFAQIRAGVTADGQLAAFDAHTWGTGGAGGTADFPLPYLYVFPHRRRTHTDVFINAAPSRPMRGADHPQGCFITEVLIDELADAVRLDPLTLRLKNLPPPSPAAMWHRYFPIGAERIGWSERHATGDPAAGALKRGLGCAAHRWRGSGTAARARVEVFPDGRVAVSCGTQDLGTGTRTVVALVAAETLGIAVDQVRVEIGDSRLPPSGASMASATAAAVSSAVRVTATLARDQLLDRIAPAVKGLAAAESLSWRDACKLLGAQPLVVEAAGDRALSGAGSSGVQFAEVEVDVDTGITRVRRIVCVQDCGLILNRQTAESQCIGGIVAGLNYALYEERLLDRHTAHMVNPTMDAYRVAGHADLPAIEVVLVDEPARGVIGVGDPPTVATAAAIANAVRNATGVRVRSLPITPDKLLTELERAGGT